MIDQPWRDTRQLRIGDAERNDALEVLGEHFAEGRLDREEYDERCQQALAARTASDLTPLFTDLPGRRPAALVPSGSPGPAYLPPGVRPGAVPRSRVPFLPVLLVLVAMAIILGEFWIIPLGLAGWLLFRNAARRRAGRPQANGNRRP